MGDPRTTKRIVLFKRVEKTLCFAVFEKIGRALLGEKFCINDCPKKGGVGGEEESLVLGAGEKKERG